MSSYTMELRKVCDIYTREEVETWFSSYNLEDYLTEEQIETISTAGIWTKQKLAKKIVDHYFMREIGLETPYLFRHFAKTKMQEIMERKLPLIYSKSIEFNPLVNVDFEEKYTKNIQGTNTNNQTSSNEESIEQNIEESIEEEKSGSGTSSSTANNSSSGLTVNSDTPQGQISKQNILNGSYASSTSANENSSTITDSTTTTSSNDGTISRSNDSSISRTNDGSIHSNGSDTRAESFTRTMKGNSGSITTAQHLIQQYRDIIVAVDEEIINELNSLFIGLF